MLELKLITFGIWITGVLLVMLMTATGKMRPDDMNNVPWSQCLKSPQHQVFIVTVMAFVMMFIVA